MCLRLQCGLQNQLIARRLMLSSLPTRPSFTFHPIRQLSTQPKPDKPEALKPIAPAANIVGPPQLTTSLWNATFTFASIASLAGVHFLVSLPALAQVVLIPPFAASCCVLFEAHAAPVSQPRNVVGGHFVSSIAGVMAYKVVGVGLALGPVFACPVAAALSVLSMSQLRVVHPPAAATALIAVIGGDAIHSLGWSYCVVPCLISPLCLVALATAFNRAAGRKYPQSWN